MMFVANELAYQWPRNDKRFPFTFTSDEGTLILINEEERPVIVATNTGLPMAALRKADADGISEGFQFELPLPQGTRWFELSLSRKRGAPGEMPHFVVLSRDITERKEGDAALRESVARLARVMEGSDQGFWDWNLESNEFTVSPRFETMLGYAPGEMNLAPENWAAYVHPDDLAVAHASIQRHLHDEAPYHEAELRCREKSGDWHWVLTRGRIVERDASGRALIMSGTHSDIAERKRAEAELERHRNHLSELVEQKTRELSVAKEAAEAASRAKSTFVANMSQLNVGIDEGNGDFLSLKGEAVLNGGVDKSGKTTLTGSYELDAGAYEMSFNFLRRRFDIQRGSKITWIGEPTNATLDITAVYIANTSATELVQDQITAARTDLRYRQRLPFEVLLNMDGALMQPILTFDIRLPEESSVRIDNEIAGQVELRLNQLKAEPSELNKQVFALLLLNRFVSENPFESAGGVINAGSLARQSVSKLLTEQLNNLAGDLIAGVDINF